jgi:uncharacterized protein (TIGR00255 family)
MAVSMTAFVSRELLLPMGVAYWELRSVNHRYLELSFKLPETLRDLEPSLRELMRQHVSRGRIDCCLKLGLRQDKVELNVDFQLIKQLIEASQKIAERFSLASSIALFDILSWPSVIRASEEDFSELKKILLESFQGVLADLNGSRTREGIKLKRCIQERLLKMETQVNKIERRLPEIQKVVRVKLSEKLAALKISYDNHRFEEEMVYLIQKMDIAEEIDRLKLHLMEAQRILTEEKVMGRRLDFLMQELNRETNTLMSKVPDSITIQDAVEVKVLIEEIREQVQNLE